MDNMDKYDLVLHIVENAEKYSAEELKEILSDSETREIYDLLCTTVSAAKENKPIGVNSQWQSFSRRHLHKPRRKYWFGNRAASITVFLVASLVAVAIGIGVSVSVFQPKHEDAVGENVIDTTHYAVTTISDTVDVVQDSIHKFIEPVLFEDATLKTIMQEVTKVYGVDVIFNDKAVSELHLYYRFDPNLSLDEIVSQLNTFEQIHITRSYNTLKID